MKSWLDQFIPDPLPDILLGISEQIERAASMNDGFYWDGLTRRSLFTCYAHGRFIDSATGLCPTCQREAKEQAETRANNEAVRRIAVEAEAAVMAEMWGLA